MRIIKLSIENFKGVKSKKVVDFSSSQTLLRGPNGFGKTTIFDVIELCLTGSIKRVIDKSRVTNDSKDYTDAFYRNTAQENVTLKLLIENDRGERIVIVKHLPFNHDGNFDGTNSRTRKFKVVDSLEKMPTYILNEAEFDEDNFFETHSPEGNYEEKIQQLIFGANTTFKIKDIYKLFGYIQQEENTFYLRMSESERRGELDFLYNLQDQATEIDELSKNLEQLKKADDALKNELQNLTVAQKIQGNKNLVYEQIFDYIELEFDQEEPFAKASPRTIDANYQGMLDYIGRVKRFSETFDIEVYRKSVRKRILNRLAVNQDFLQYSILKDFLRDDTYNKIIAEFRLASWVQRDVVLEYYILQPFLKSEVLSGIQSGAQAYAIAGSYFEKYQNLTVEEKLRGIIQIKNKTLLTDERLAQGVALNQQLEQAKKAVSTSSAALATIGEVRNSLTNAFSHLNKDEGHEASSCPYCGHDWEKYEALAQAISTKDEEFKRLNKEQLTSFAKLKDEVKATYLDPLEKHFHELMTKHHRGHKFYQKLKSINESVSSDDFEKFKSQFEAVVADSKAQIWDKIKSQEELEKGVSALKDAFVSRISYDGRLIERLQQLKGFNFEKQLVYIANDLPQDDSWKALQNLEKLTSDAGKIAVNLSEVAAGIEIDQEKLGGSDSGLFKEVFLEKAENIERTAKKLDLKVDYIALKYSQKKNELYELLSSRHEKIKAVRAKLNTLRNDYKTAVNEYKNIMTDAVKIPFHIYSARILQNYSQGYGAFIDTPSQATSSIRFSAGSGSDHDLVHQLSSGQLAVVSMAFSLAINKVYGSASLRFLAIDDPVQELDALNVFSLVELLRNDYGDNYQLLLSTHDELHADYMEYKFALDNTNVKSLKVQDIFFPSTQSAQL